MVITEPMDSPDFPAPAEIREPLGTRVTKEWMVMWVNRANKGLLGRTESLVPTEAKVMLEIRAFLESLVTKVL